MEETTEVQTPSTTSLNDLIGTPSKSTPSPAPAAEAAPEAEAEADPGTPAPAETTAEAAPATAEVTEGDVTDDEGDVTKQVSGLKRAAQAERQKRQEMQAELAALRAQLETPQRDPLEVFHENPVNYVQDTVKLQLAAMSIDLARTTIPDFDEKHQAFLQAAESNPALMEQVKASPNPGKEIYQLGQSIQFYQKYGTDPATISKKLEAELRPKLKAELEKEYLGRIHDKSNQPTNILGARSSGGGSAAEWKPSSLLDLV